MYRYTTLVIMLLSLTACGGNYKLVSFGLYSTLREGASYDPYKAPESPVEMAVIETANSTTTTPLADCDVMFTHQYQSAKYVAVVERSDDDDRFSDKNVVRYKVIDGKIAAKTGTFREFFTNIEFERAVVAAALRSKSIIPVLLYDDSDTTVGMASRPMGDCAAKVIIYSNPPSRSTPIAEKNVVYCF